MSLVTWNMQGGTDSIESKWTKYVQQLVKNFNVVCLQEAGTLPNTAVLAAPPVWGTAAPPAGFNWESAADAKAKGSGFPKFSYGKGPA